MTVIAVTVIVVTVISGAWAKALLTELVDRNEQVAPEVTYSTIRIRLTPVASDVDGDTLTYSANGLPAGLVINSSTGQISGSPTVAGSYNTVISVNDGNGGSDTTTFSWVVTDNSAACGGMIQEAEEGQLFGNMVTATDYNASHGSYIHVPNGNGNAGFGSASRAVYCFDVANAGTYQLLGRVLADSGVNNSFFVTVDGQPSNGYLWDVDINSSYALDYLSNRNGADPVEFFLTEGEHTIVVYRREDGTRLDKLILEPAKPSLRSASISAGIDARGILGSLTDMSAYSVMNAGTAMESMTVTLLDEATRGEVYRESVVTDASGRFFFDTMPVGSYVVAVEVDGQYFEEPVNAGDESVVGVTFGIDQSAIDAQESTAGMQIQIFIPFVNVD